VAKLVESKRTKTIALVQNFIRILPQDGITSSDDLIKGAKGQKANSQIANY